MDTGGVPPGPFARAARALVVVSLLAIAAIGLRGRGGLDWRELTRAPDVAWAQLVLAATGAAVVVLGVRQLLRLWRRLRPARPAESLVFDPQPVPWVGWLIGLAVMVAWMAASYFLIRLLLDGASDSTAAAPPAPDTGSSPVQADDLLPVLLGLVMLLAVGALLIRALRGGPSLSEQRDKDEGPEAAVLADAVHAAGAEMEVHGDTRTAIIAAYRVMAAQLGQGAGRLPSDTPTELLDRAVAAGLVSRGAALELTELFREARFSRHELPADTRAAAEAALSRVSAELVVSRA